MAHVTVSHLACKKALSVATSLYFLRVMWDVFYFQLLSLMAKFC